VLLLIQSATLVTAVWTSGLGPNLRLGLVVVGASVAVAVIELLVGGHTVLGVVGLLNVVLVGAVMGAVVLGVVDQGEVNRQSIVGAICIYVEIGMLFTFVYGAVAAIGAGSLFAQGTDGTPSLRLYFSYVTLATLGYGDYTPAGNLGHTLAVAEAMLGQLYLVTVVALLVARLNLRQRDERR